MTPDCPHDVARIDVIPGHPCEEGMWVRETCEACGAQRVAEHWYSDESAGIDTTGATPWR
jgi:hypothetical protein